MIFLSERVTYLQSISKAAIIYVVEITEERKLASAETRLIAALQVDMRRSSIKKYHHP